MESLLNGDSPETFRFGVMSAFESAGGTIAGVDVAAANMYQNGVVLNLVATTRELNFDLGVDGVKIELKK